MYLKENVCVRVHVVVDYADIYADMRFSNFAIKYLRENEKVRETIVIVRMGPRSNLKKKNNGRKSYDTTNFYAFRLCSSSSTLLIKKNFITVFLKYIYI